MGGFSTWLYYLFIKIIVYFIIIVQIANKVGCKQKKSLQINVIGATCSGHVHDQALRATSSGQRVHDHVFRAISEPIQINSFRTCSEQSVSVLSNVSEQPVERNKWALCVSCWPDITTAILQLLAPADLWLCMCLKSQWLEHTREELAGRLLMVITQPYMILLSNFLGITRIICCV
jgi:hypothetical protein